MAEPGRRVARHERLHWRIYLAVLASVATVALLAALSWHLSGRKESGAGFETAAEIAGEVLPATAPRPDLQPVLDRWHRRMRADLSLYTASGELVAFAGERVPFPPGERRESGFFRRGLGPPAAALHLPDGRWLLARHPHRAPAAIGFLWFLVLVAAAVALAAWPLSRRLTRRLARLEESVDALGAGDLSVRVPVEGRDEVARLAESFNRAAERVEALVGAQKRLLANASHELRSPLARMRVAVSLLEGDATLKDEVVRNVSELDALVEEILLASRLDAGTGGDEAEQVDLAALAAEECARAGASFAGEVVVVTGSPRLLRRMVRNLVENAVRHGGPRTREGSPESPEVEVFLSRGPGGVATLDVADRGPGVPAEARERIFEPFFRLAPAWGGGGGTGLGLSLARQVARRHGGDVVCLPREGGGSLFRATLPAGA